MNRYSTLPPLPDRIRRLEELAVDLWWSWHPQGRAVFRRLDYDAVARDGTQPGTHALGHSARQAGGGGERSGVPRPLRSGRRGPRRGARGAQHVVGAQPAASVGTIDRVLLGRIRAASVAAHLCRRPRRAGWRSLQRGRATSACPSSASGSCTRRAYFHQHVSAEGWQEETNELLNWADAPIEQATTPDGLALPDRPCRSTIDRCSWRSGACASAGCTLYLLDTDLEENAPWDRELSARLYGGDRETRIQQEIILGIGGVRALRALGIEPAVFHLNEGHAAFVVLQRIRELIDRGSTFDDALAEIRQTTVFTTHTPVAGRPRRVPVSPRRKASGRLLGHARSQSRTVPRARVARQRRGRAVQHDGARLAIRRLGQCGQPAPWPRDTRDVGTIWPGVPAERSARDVGDQRRARAHVDRGRSGRALRRAISARTGSSATTIRRSGTACSRFQTMNCGVCGRCCAGTCSPSSASARVNAGPSSDVGIAQGRRRRARCSIPTR